MYCKSTSLDSELDVAVGGRRGAVAGARDGREMGRAGQGRCCLVKLWPDDEPSARVVPFLIH